MRVLFGIFCLAFGLPSVGLAEEREATRQEKIERYRAVIAEIAAGDPLMAKPAHDLPAAVREIIEASSIAPNRPTP